MYGERDVLVEAVEEGKARGLAVIPWVEHRDWLAKRKDETTDFSRAETTKSYWVAHSHPEAQRFPLELMLELDASYDVPAIQFDWARCREKNCGYDETTTALYAAGQISGFVAELSRSLTAASF